MEISCDGRQTHRTTTVIIDFTSCLFRNLKQTFCIDSTINQVRVDLVTLSAVLLDKITLGGGIGATCVYFTETTPCSAK